VLVLGYDASPSAIAALRETTRLAKDRNARVEVVFGYHITPWGGTPEGSIREAVQDVGAHALARAVADLKADDISVESRLVEAKPADALLQVADETGAEAIVVGSGGESHPIVGALLGSVVLRLIQRSTVPVLVVPGGE
jgi:nucleotide-binding universal stress UspA family protein